MIKYRLKCEQDHSFDSWFQSSDAFEKLESAGLLSCSVCGTCKVKRSLMAPSVPAKSADNIPSVDAPDAAVEQAISQMREEVEKNSDYVGMNFAAEARAMHLGDKPERAIYGSAKAEDAKALIEDGVPVTPLPFVPKRNTN